MSATVTIQPEALALAEARGVRQALDRMLEQMKAMTPQLKSIAVEVEIHPEDPTFPHLIAIDGVEARSARPATDLSLLENYWQWLIDNYPPDITMNFVYSIAPRG